MATIAIPSYDGHPVSLDIGKPRMAKADVRKPDIDWQQQIARAIQRAVALVGWSNKEAAANIGVDDAEFGKWLNGTRRPQFDKLLANDELRWPVIRCLAQLDECVQFDELLRRRTA